MRLDASVNVMKNRLDLLKTEENRRISLYGEYYIFVKTIDILRCGREEFNLGRYPMLIRAVFETSPKYFDKEYIERWRYNIPLSVSVYTISQSIYNFDISIYFPGLTTLNILNKKGFIKLLLADEEIYDALVNLFDAYSVNNALPVLPGNPPTSTFESFLKRQIIDFETRLKLQIDYPIIFEDIEEAQDIEIREQALRKFGYENYVKEGFKKGKIRGIKYDNDVDVSPFPSAIDHYTIYNHNAQRLPHQNIQISRPSYCDEHEKLIYFWDSEIAFLQVKDSSSGKSYFLKVPHDMESVREAKAWTFGLEKGEYNPEIET